MTGWLTATLGYLFVVGEETDSIGAKTANKMQWNTEYLVVGEKLMVGRSGDHALVVRPQKG